MGNTGVTGIRAPDHPNAQLAWAELLGETYALYGQRFWTFFRLALLPSALAYGFGLIRQLYLNTWLRSVAPAIGPGLNVSKAMVFGLSVGYINGLVYVILSGFYFAAVASAILRRGESEDKLSDGFSVARRRLGPVIAIACLIWTLFFLGRALAMFALTMLLGRLRLGKIVWFIAILTMLLALVGLLSRMGAAIPAIVSDETHGFRSALGESVDRTEGTELFFMAFMLKSAILAYAALWLVNLGLDRLWERGALNEVGYLWASPIVFISLAAMLESPLFIAFSLLYKGAEQRDPSAAIIS